MNVEARWISLGDSGLRSGLSANARYREGSSSLSEMRLGSLGVVRTGVGVLTCSDNRDGPAVENGSSVLRPVVYSAIA